MKIKTTAAAFRSAKAAHRAALKVSRGTLEVSCGDEGHGYYRESIAVDYEGEPFAVRYDRRYLVDALTPVGEHWGLASIKLSDPDRWWIATVQPCSEPTAYQCIISPLSADP